MTQQNTSVKLQYEPPIVLRIAARADAVLVAPLAGGLHFPLARAPPARFFGLMGDCMPLQHLDADANAVKDLAEKLAQEQELEYVGTEHILLAILKHGGGVGAKVLAEYNIDEARAKKKIDELIQHDKEDTWVFGRLPGSPHYRNVIALAIDEATQLESSVIGSAHLLLALLREKGSTAQRALHALGVTLQDCRERVVRHLSEAA